MRNWISTENTFKLAPPPQWWLKQLHDYDAQLVVFPSRIRMAYILARRRHHSNAMAELDTLDKDIVRKSAGLDGDILANNNLIYVRHLIGNTIRRQELFQWLKDHDTWANGGAAKVAQAIEDQEVDDAQRKRATLVDNIEHRARDAWRSYQARTGRRQGAVRRTSATIMPVQRFTPAESSVAMFVKD